MMQGCLESIDEVLKERPACLFSGARELLPTGSDEWPTSNCCCHYCIYHNCTTYDFFNDALPLAVLMLLRIVEDRFGLELYTLDEVLNASMTSKAWYVQNDKGEAH